MNFRYHNNLEWISVILVSKRSQSQKATYYLIPCMWHSRVRKILEITVGVGIDWEGGRGILR